MIRIFIDKKNFINVYTPDDDDEGGGDGTCAWIEGDSYKACLYSYTPDEYKEGSDILYELPEEEVREVLQTLREIALSRLDNK